MWDMVVHFVDIGWIIYHHICINNGLWCLTALSTIFQLYRGGQFYWWRKPEKTTDWQTLSHSVVSSSPRLSGIQTHNVSGDRHWFQIKGSCKSNYHTITTTTGSTQFQFSFHNVQSLLKSSKFYLKSAHIHLTNNMSYMKPLKPTLVLNENASFLFFYF
jgi:hypothetical protein